MYSQTWPHSPTIYEINTWAWLADLSTKYGSFVELGSVPAAEWDAIAEFGFDELHALLDFGEAAERRVPQDRRRMYLRLAVARCARRMPLHHFSFSPC